MKYIDEFRDGELARNIARTIAAEADPVITSYSIHYTKLYEC